MQSTEGGQYLEKKKADLAEALFCSPGERSPAPPISMLGRPPPKFVPKRTKVWRNGTCLTGNPNIEIGGRGQRHTPTAPQDMPEFSQHLCSVLFSKFCPPTVEWSFSPRFVLFRAGLMMSTLSLVRLKEQMDRQFISHNL